MPVKRTTITQCVCARCGHQWIPRKGTDPVQCPRCHSPYWNRPRIKHKKVRIDTKRRR